MKGFAKIIELEKHDVVIMRESDDENQEHITMTTRLKGVIVTSYYNDACDRLDVLESKVISGLTH